ncbi:MAG: DEAD/DEAH box helicase family protein [Eubacterium sp.]|nr:DEAD/DEAH box helicase family protein [Eubacterium sp.]MCI8918918.1 DEAD/DEAH box helicase family protein [Eubacterium sp.]
MKTISSNEIESVASSRSVFDRGYSLFSSDGVLRIELEREKNGSHTIYAMVEGSMGAHYNTRASIVLHKNTMRVSGFSCNCKAAETYAGACKHVVATLFEYNYQYEEESDEAGADYVQSSDEELKSLVDYYVMQDRNQFCQEYGNGDVRLIPILHLEADRESMELKIGTTQMYVVKDIGELVDNIKQMRHVSYGKKLAFTHSQSAFTRESTSIVNLLLELDSENEFSYRYHGWGYSNQQMRRSCTLSPAMLDRLMELYEGRTLQVDDQLLDQKDEIPIVRKNPRLPLNITGLHEQGAQVQMEPVFLTEGSKQWYILWNHCFYICTREYYEQVKGFLRLMTQERNQMKKYAGYYGRYGYYQEQLKMPTFYLSVQDYGAFAKNVLPMVQDVLDVQVKKIDFESYEPLEAVFHSYLDKVGSHIECRAKVLYGTQEYDVAEIPTKEQASRDIRREFQVRTILEGYFELAKDQKTYVSKEEDAMLEFLETGFQQLESVSEIFATDRFKNMRVIPMPKITAGISVKGNLLDVSWDVEGMSAQEVMDILADYKNKKKYHKLKSGDFLRMDENSLAVLVELNEGLHLTKEQLKERKAEVPLYRSLYLDSLMKDNADHIRLERDKEFRTVIREMRSMEDGENEIPQQIQAVLRPYQEIGFQWLCALAKFGFGGILADDMGLGKTLQVLAFLASQPGTHALVVCPASLVFNWEAECQRFYPSAKIAAVAGAAAARQMQIEDFDKQDILITSYDLLKRDIDCYENKYFDYVIVDEAQYIKNASTQAAKSVKSIASGCRFALTGTPIENRLSELWSIFEFLMPGYLYSYKRFKDELESPVAESKDDVARMRLSRLVRPFILRRLKKDVLKELPDKIEEVVYARMEGRQNSLYQAREKQLLMTLSKQTEEEFKTQKLQMLAELTALRQICCDPSLVYENYEHESAKTKTCVEVVQNAVSGGHKVLLFSQFATMLDRLFKILQEQGLRIFMLTGKTSKEERRRLVAEFQSGAADVFLISLKAGGTGLNLTAADMVIHYDPWWNIAAQNQATDRAHRIGQDNKVTVLRLIMKGTIEERILKMQEDKQNLADSIISEDGVSIAGLDKEQLISVLEEKNS